MAANIHAILLLLTPLLAAVVLLLVNRRKPEAKHIIVGWLLAILVMCAANGIRHMCDEGQPRNQWLISGICLFVILVFVDKAKWRRIFGVLFAFAAFGLSCHMTDLVHERGWTGNPDYDFRVGCLKLVQQQFLKTVDNMLAADEIHPAGWLRDLPIWTAMKDLIPRPDVFPHRRVMRNAWHTWLTGLYPYETVRQDFWFPGGTLRESGAGIELRDRPKGQ